VQKDSWSIAYLGLTFWGMVLVFASTNDIALRIAACLLTVVLVVVLIITINVGLEFSTPNFQTLPSFINSTNGTLFTL
jgi:hypothetical protein